MSETPKESGMRPQLIVNEGDTVVFDENGEKKAFIKIRAKGCAYDLMFVGGLWQTRVWCKPSMQPPCRAHAALLC